MLRDRFPTVVVVLLLISFIAPPAGATDVSPISFGQLGAAQAEPTEVAEENADDAVSADEASDDELTDEAEPASEGDEVDALDTSGGATATNEEVTYGGEAKSDSIGGATGFVFPTGFYMSSDLGGFLRFGGYGDSRDGSGCLRCVPKWYSNLQPWIGVNVGYDILPWVGIETTLGFGFVADAAPVGYAIAVGEGQPPGVLDSPENSSITMATVALTGSWFFLDRLAIQGKGFVGGSMLSPDPDPSRYNLVRAVTCTSNPLSWGQPVAGECQGFGSDFGMTVGAGIGLRYATLLSNVVIGFDTNVHATLNPIAGNPANGTRLFFGATGIPLMMIPSFSFAPVVKYVF